VSKSDFELKLQALAIDAEALQVMLDALLGAVAARTPTIFADWEEAVERRLDLMAAGARLGGPGRAERVKAVEGVVRGVRCEVASRPWPIRKRAGKV
jgi:hypothetical protein